MSLDQHDVAKTTIEVQQGQGQRIYPIIIDPYNNGNSWSVGEEHEINIAPCDSIWIPTFYDPSLGLNPGQTFPNAEGLSPFTYQGPNGSCQTLFQNPIPQIAGGLRLGMNAWDQWSENNTGFWTQTAPIFSIRINSTANPWMLFGLSTLLSQQVGPGGDPETGMVGTGDVMRSISCPIARLWVKFLYFSIGAGGYDNDPRPFYSRVVLLSSLGISQMTSGVQRVTDGATSACNPYSFGSGGYRMPDMNSADRAKVKS